MTDPIWSLMANGSTGAVSSSGATSKSSSKDPADSLGKDAFMRLLLNQMQNQDPLNPMDGADFFAQLAQLSLLEQMYQLNDTLSASQRQQQLVQAGTLIGRKIEATLQDGTSVSGVVDGVHMVDNVVYLDVNGSQVALGDVTTVQAQGGASSG